MRGGDGVAGANKRESEKRRESEEGEKEISESPDDAGLKNLKREGKENAVKASGRASRTRGRRMHAKEIRKIKGKGTLALTTMLGELEVQECQLLLLQGLQLKLSRSIPRKWPERRGSPGAWIAICAGSAIMDPMFVYVDADADLEVELWFVPLNEEDFDEKMTERLLSGTGREEG